MRQQFLDSPAENDSSPLLQLSARAKQFSSFLLLIGNIAAADLFDPKYAFIVRNKDEILVPLSLETIPSVRVKR